MPDTLKPTVSPLQLRDELESMVRKELLGPGTEDEEIIESPGTRYFVGVLAPQAGPKPVQRPPRLSPCQRHWLMTRWARQTARFSTATNWLSEVGPVATGALGSTAPQCTQASSKRFRVGSQVSFW
jgi:hypothetical protein